jgi:hypothetical protein
MFTVSTSLVRSEHSLAMVSFARLISNRYGQLSQLADSGEDRVLSNAFLPSVDDPDQCNALGASIWEIVALSRHYHPTIAKSAANAVKFETLEPQFQDPVNVLRLFSTKSAGFNPAIRLPSKRKMYACCLAGRLMPVLVAVSLRELAVVCWCKAPTSCA